MRVLLVDDDDAARVTLAALLEDEGFSVEEAASLADADRALRAAFDVVILDVHLGDGLGSALLPAIHAQSPRPRVVVASGSSEDTAFGDASFVKGGAFEDLARIVRSLLAA